MKRIILGTIVFWFVFLCNVTFADLVDRENHLSTEIQQILTSNRDDLNAGIIIENTVNKKVLFLKNPDRLFIPASNIKLVTAYASLTTLKPDFVFQTAIYADTSQIKNGVLAGNVYLKFGGDPSFTSDQLNTLIKALEQAGIKKITGHFIIVNDDFGDVGYGRGWMLEDAKYCYGEAANSMVVDHNCFSVSILPGTKKGSSAILRKENANLPIVFHNRVITAENKTKCHLMVKGDDVNNYKIVGCINRRWHKAKNPLGFNLAVRNVNLYVKQLVNCYLKQNHILLTGAIQFGTLNPNAKLLLVNNSDPLPKLLADMLKPSDNLYANAFFLKLGQVYYGGPGSWKKSQKAVQCILETKLGINPKSWSVVDGSGESRYNFMTPRQMLSLLNSVYKQPAISSVLIPALPISGIDGTLEHRMKDNFIKGRVMAKTGTMKGISSLSGFINTPHGTLIMVMFMNNFLGHGHNYQLVQDRICEYLAR